MAVTPSLDVDGFQTNLSYPGQPGAQMPNKRCCGCFAHIYDHFDGTDVWPCYWNAQLSVDPSGSTITKDKTQWIVEDSKLKMDAIATNPSFPTLMRSDQLWFKLRPLLPPWTIQFAYKLKRAPFSNPSTWGGTTIYQHQSDIRVFEGAPRLHLYPGGGPDQYHKFIMDIDMNTLSPNVYRAYTVDDFPNAEYEIYQRLSVDSNREVTVDLKIDGTRPDLEPTDGIGNPYITSFPYTTEMTVPSTANRWWSTKCYSLNIRPLRGNGRTELDYLEAHITPGIL